jgi:hypothetical protein
MSVTSRSPLRFAGAVLNSGNVNTGEQNLTLGGSVAASIYSGMVSGAASLLAAFGAVAAGADILFFSGAGRLKDVFTHQPNSGVAAPFFYDAASPTGSGPNAQSGSKVIGSFSAPTLSGSSPAGQYYSFDFPFQSGLCCGPMKSGFPGFTVTYTPEANPALANPG